MDLPLEGVRVLEVGGGIPAAYAGRVLAGYGADVVRTEAIGGVPLTSDDEVYLVAGSRRVAVDPTTDPAAFRALALAADIIVEDQAPGTLASWGCDPTDLRAAKPGLVIVSITPFGQTGPNAACQATNIVSFASGGLMSLTGTIERTPLVTGGNQAHYLAGLNASSAALCGYYGAMLQGEGDWVDLSMQELAASMNELYGPGTSYGQPVQLRMGNHVRGSWGIYPCVDGWAGVFCLERQIPAWFGLLDDPELTEPRFRDPLQRLLPENDELMKVKGYVFFAEHTKAELLELGPKHRVPFGVAMTPADLLASDGLAERGFFDTVDTPEGPATVPGRPFPGYGWRPGQLAAPGADTEAVLADWGVTAAR